ncbi:hypothetical protein CHELA41_40097 [Hyphomicrobiales bacterium]|nr:hypothetical protein CHELA41_40097 [Hyphomicrobiales bacterium]
MSSLARRPILSSFGSRSSDSHGEPGSHSTQRCWSFGGSATASFEKSSRITGTLPRSRRLTVIDSEQLLEPELLHFRCRHWPFCQEHYSPRDFEGRDLFLAKCHQFVSINLTVQIAFDECDGDLAEALIVRQSLRPRYRIILGAPVSTQRCTMSRKAVCSSDSWKSIFASPLAAR